MGLDMMITEPPKKLRWEIEAEYMQMFNWGMMAIPEYLGGNYISIAEWRDRELAKLESKK
jgi:hypothetical protein